jgi:death on curing protein
VLELHEEAIGAFGGSAGVRDQGLLASAVATPQASFGGDFLHPDLFAMAAAYAFHLCKNHPFVDGNKRTAFYATLVFLERNGIAAPDEASGERLADALIAVAEDRLDKDELVTLLRILAPTGP